MRMSRLVLGTVQLGMDYGVANTSGKPDRATAKAIVALAWEHGIREFDTAQGYGDSEAVLGEAFAEMGVSQEAAVISKPHPNVDINNPKRLRDALQSSLDRLRIERLRCLLWHREDILDHQDAAVDNLGCLRDEGLTSLIGVSVYSPSMAVRALESDWTDAIQIPGNILDRRFERAGIFELAKRKGKRIYIRSVFLQGLLLMPRNQAVLKVPAAEDTLNRYHGFLAEHGLTPLEAALHFAQQAYPHSSILFGAESESQIREVLNVWAEPNKKVMDMAQKAFSDVPETVLNPTRW